MSGWVRNVGRGLAIGVVTVLLAGCATDPDEAGVAAGRDGPTTATTAAQTQSPTADESGSSAPSSTPPGLPTAEPSPTATASPTFTSSPAAVSPGPASLPAFDWLDPAPLGLAGWSFRGCDAGAAQQVCVSRSDGASGVIAISSVPSTAPLRARARAFLAGVRQDRQQRCGSGYTVAANRTVLIQAGGTEVVRYGFTGTSADGQPSELMVQYAGRRGADLVVLSATARDPGGCLPLQPDGFTSTELAPLLPVLDALVRAAQFPTAP